MWPTIIVGSIVAASFVWVIVTDIKNKRKGKSCCSCSGGGCGLDCHKKD